ncbi:MAG: L,D-transpeptidase family protein [Chelatococcus sp.]|jgi:L,D-peptidoglycan transpeptidase YkuD (ErfK/YbiS/YcfS/YnhG family)|uniref:L,D-transpeptidase family protein n=1 Tax=unclassified Chelatococcus TaxID=2638111 RepID=UPI001BCC6EA8|nr:MULTISPECIES: L,D-transpeptidase family protein [unclassified Chelatococcus]CAH1657449.1 L,D-peptidoglycan transpeptidase YkuD (ErfK/YbiS/YcfS/YnhG family) [Hyphomicrobiales bacterium]MBS7740683.1 L,D-transpeptidase family protein [Chelatococcus sp. HY11]MBX3539161.1 L,D-transpeptidase family protein [Chelatococcus sp.]MBX3546083.1 L,D-transpeptidase family protein [Chelatococcus sp.]MCO5079832.1 L,D-transpeptidase family protein [Chelatococcus sp.]
MKRTTIPVVHVYASPLDRARGVVVAGALRLPCALGRSGIAVVKREGDGRTPRGRFGLLGLTYRADHGARPRSGLPTRVTRRSDGWCDAPGDRRYNCPVVLPYPASTETLWRDDDLYNAVVDIAWNRGPRIAGRGSAIFLHVARSGFKPTEGCVAVDAKAIRRLLAVIGPHTVLSIH